MTNSRAKGKRGELELKTYLNEHGYDTRRGQQYCGTSGDADVVGLEHIHIECKRVENLNIQKAYEQSVRDAREEETPVVIHRRNRQPWMVTLSLEDWLPLYAAWKETYEEQG